MRCPPPMRIASDLGDPEDRTYDDAHALTAPCHPVAWTIERLSTPAHALRGEQEETVSTTTEQIGAAVTGFRQGHRGSVVQPGDEGYDAARTVWNGMIDRRPALIARCADTADVVAAVIFARQQGLGVAIRGG